MTRRGFYVFQDLIASLEGLAVYSSLNPEMLWDAWMLDRKHFDNKCAWVNCNAFGAKVL